MNLFLKYIHNLSETGYWFDRALLPTLERFVQTQNSAEKTVVDFGCGQKPFGYLFADFQGKYQGLDVYPGGRVDIVYDGGAIPLEDETVDLLFASSVFEHVRDLEYTFCEISRVLRPGGQLVGVIP